MSKSFMPQDKETGRVEAFSDGVFAIAMTLLALDLKRPPRTEVTGNLDLWLKLAASWPSFLTFFTSFGAVLTMWVNHHSIFNFIRKTNRPLLFANGFLLMLVVTVPFTTALLTEHFNSPGSNTAAAVYAAVFALINIAFLILWRVASHDRLLLRSDVEEQTVGRLHNALLRGIPFYILAFFVSFFSDKLAIVILTMLWIYWAMQRRRHRS